MVLPKGPGGAQRNGDRASEDHGSHEKIWRGVEGVTTVPVRGWANWPVAPTTVMDFPTMVGDDREGRID